MAPWFCAASALLATLAFAQRYDRRLRHDASAVRERAASLRAALDDLGRTEPEFQSDQPG